MALFLLRTYRITLAPLLVYGVLLWGLGLSGGYWLAYHGLGPWPATQHPSAFWMTSAVALGLVAVVCEPVLMLTLLLRTSVP